MAMYSFFILSEHGSEKDEIGKSGSAHVLEHFIIHALIKIYFENEKNNINGVTSFSYSIYSWSHLSYQKGLNIMNEFESRLQFILNNRGDYIQSMLTAIKEVQEELKTMSEIHISLNKMIQILSNGSCMGNPIGLKQDIDKLNVESVFKVLKKYYQKRRLSFFIFDHDADSFTLIHKYYDKYRKKSNRSGSE